MDTTKYYFEQETQEIKKTDECIFLNRKFLSIECKTCDNCKGYDKEGKWIKCWLYHFYIIAISQTHMINRYQKNIKDRDERLDFLNIKLKDAYTTIQDMKENYDDLNSNGGY